MNYLRQHSEYNSLTSFKPRLIDPYNIAVILFSVSGPKIGSYSKLIEILI